MSPSSEGSSRPRALAVGLALGGAFVLALSLATWWWHIAGHKMRGIAQYFFARQDMWVLDAQAVALGALALWAWAIARRPEGPPARSWPAILHAIPLAIALAVLVAWAGRHVIFHGYSASRDELMVELAGAYLAQGHVGWPIPPEWLPFQRAIMPEFYSPYGADTHWTAIYLPVHAAIRALFVRLGDADLAAAITLGVGLLLLWHVARKLLPGRPDAVLVTMVMALTSAQLIATAMTPFAMTSHFTFNLAWLALVLRGDRLGHGLAALVALLAAGLHQWHFPLLFIAPFILWMAANRRWGAALFHALVCLALMVVWARLWPMALTDLVGPPPPADIHRTNGIMDKLVSLVGRLDSWQPLLNNARLVSWNNPLLLPLAGLSILAISWRTLPRAVPITLPLLLGALAGMGLALFQGYGWGFRYMHGQLGGLCLLAGLGWCAVTRDGWRISARASGPIPAPAPMPAPGRTSPSDATSAPASKPLSLSTSGPAPMQVTCMRLVAASALFALLSGGWLLSDTGRYVRGYARAMAAIRAADADVVLVDIRGGYYMSDLVRLDEGRLGRPVVMALHKLSVPQLDQLCSRHSVAIMDWKQFWPLGVERVSPVYQGSDQLQQRRDHLAALGCGRPVVMSPTAPSA